MASIADTQWATFCSNVVHEWSGSWTFWNADTRQVRSKFHGVRSFVALDEPATKIKHQIRFENEDGTGRLARPEHEGPWEILKEETDDRGVRHPARRHARAVLHSNGGGVWTGLQVTDPFAVELFLSREEFRCSVILSYNESKQLRSFGTIREKKLNTQDEMWSSSPALQNGLPVLLSKSDEDFIGVEKTLDKDLQLKVVSECTWNKEFWLNGTKEVDAESDTVIFLPDNICLSCPSKLSSKSFSLRSCVLFPLGEQRELQELTVTFVDGCLHSVKQGLYH